MFAYPFYWCFFIVVSCFLVVLKNLFYVPGITKNLLSISQFTVDSKVVEFILTLVLSRISLSGKLYCVDKLRMICMSSPEEPKLYHLSPGYSQ